MPTTTPQGEIDLIDLIPADEGALKQIYGRIGNFKTYYATYLAFKLLERGQIVKTNWQIDWKGYDEREHFFHKLAALFPIIKKEFWEYPLSNWEYIEISDQWAKAKGFIDFQDWYGHQTNCTLMFDEGHVMYDSYKMTKLSMEERIKILSSRHFDRTVYVISQRPSAIHVVFRANVNQFYKTEEIEKSWFGRYFKVTEFQDTNSSDLPDETLEEVRDEDGEITESHYKFAVAEEEIRVDKKMFGRYDSKYLRKGMPDSQHNLAKKYAVNWKENLKNLFKRNATDKNET